MGSRDFTQAVVVNGVTIELFDDTAGSRFFPMRATLAWMEDHQHYEDGPPNPPEAFERLREAGVKSIPLYKSEADERKIAYTPV